MSLRVERIYGHATVQGAPLSGRRKFGCPPGGAFDPPLQQRLNARAGNAWDAPVLELALCQLTLRALDQVLLTWGGSASVWIDDVAVLDGQAGVTLCAGSVISFEVPRFGARQWVAAGGGFTEPRTGLLARGDALEVGSAPPPLIRSFLQMEVPGPPGGYLHATAGQPEFRQLFRNRYRVRHDSDRVGIRLDGPRMAHNLELPSEPATPGVVQITPEGLPIILGPDGPTIGGYPRAGVVTSADLPALAQLRPGAEVRFARSSISAAREAAFEAERMQELFLRIHPSAL